VALRPVLADGLPLAPCDPGSSNIGCSERSVDAVWTFVLPGVRRTRRTRREAGIVATTRVMTLQVRSLTLRPNPTPTVPVARPNRVETFRCHGTTDK
jgi:hypothetical protein